MKAEDSVMTIVTTFAKTVSVIFDIIHRFDWVEQNEERVVEFEDSNHLKQIIELT